MLPAPSAVKSVYRSIVRHCQHVQPSPLREVRAQFRRWRNGGKLGHMRAAYAFEQDLRDVLTPQSPMDMPALRAKYKTTSKSKLRDQNHRERNSQGRFEKWKNQPERRWDAFNYGPTEPAAKYVIKRAAGLANTRANYLRFRFTEPVNLQPALDRAVVDTVFAPLWLARRTQAAQERRAERHRRPHRVRVLMLARSGKAMAMLRVDGVKQRPRGLGRWLRVLLNNYGVAEKKPEQEDAVNGKKAQDKNKAETEKDKQAAARRDRDIMRLEVQRRIIVARSQFIQAKWNHRHKLAQEALGRKSKRPAAALRLHALEATR